MNSQSTSNFNGSLPGSTYRIAPGLQAFMDERAARDKLASESRADPEQQRSLSEPQTAQPGRTAETNPRPAPRLPPGYRPSPDPELAWPPASGEESFADESEDDDDDDYEEEEDEQEDGAKPQPSPDIDPSGWLGKGPPPWEIDAEINAAAEKEHRRVAALVQKGDVRSLLAEIVDTDSPFASFGSMLADLASAVRQRSRKDHRGLVDDTLAEVEAVLSLLVLRIGQIIQRRLQLHDKGRRASPDDWLAKDLQEVGIPSLLDLATRLAELAQIRAATARQWRLADKRQKRQGGSVKAKERRRGGTGRFKGVETGSRRKSGRDRRRA